MTLQPNTKRVLREFTIFSVFKGLGDVGVRGSEASQRHADLQPPQRRLRPTPQTEAQATLAPAR